ncbi:MAG: 30S ribosomal protein S19 [Candidatus Micrarchaeota archaeon]
MAKKEFSFRGKSTDELSKLSLQEFAKLCRSRQRRSLGRGFDKTVLKQLDGAIAKKNAGNEPKPVRTHRRNIVVIPKMIGLKFSIYKGNAFDTVDIKPEMLGHFLGEFSLTRKRMQHGKAGIGATRSSSAVTQRKT